MGVKAAFGRPHTALIFHLTNHYALIFAWREWMEEVIVETAEAAAEQMGAGEERSASEAATCPGSNGCDGGRGGSCSPRAKANDQAYGSTLKRSGPLLRGG